MTSLGVTMEMDYHGFFSRTPYQSGPTRFSLTIYVLVCELSLRQSSFFVEFVYAILGKFHA